MAGKRLEMKVLIFLSRKRLPVRVPASIHLNDAVSTVCGMRYCLEDKNALNWVVVVGVAVAVVVRRRRSMRCHDRGM